MYARLFSSYTCFLIAMLFFGTFMGCHTVRKKYDTSVPVVEEWTPPPNEERYNNPPESGYKKPPARKDAGKQGIGPMGPGGFGGAAGPGGGFGPNR